MKLDLPRRKRKRKIGFKYKLHQLLSLLLISYIGFISHYCVLNIHVIDCTRKLDRENKGKNKKIYEFSSRKET
jgi:hypothetical protein